jgi:hypothetical protein
MSINNLQQTRHNRQEIIYIISNMSYAEAFAEWLETAYQESHFKSYAELSEASGGLSRSTIASLAKAKPQTATNKASRPKRENVIAIAKALGANIDEVLQIAGHSPQNTEFSSSKDFGDVKVQLQGGQNYSEKQKEEFFTFRIAPIMTV